jgi:hypothetical protein
MDGMFDSSADSSAAKITKGSPPGLDPFEHEQRFLLTDAQAHRFLAAVGGRTTFALYDQARPLSFTRTTYFDTDDFLYLRSCDEPVARRLRLREYAGARTFDETPVLEAIASLELKQTAGTARSKIRLLAPAELLQRFIRTPAERQPARLGRAPGVPGDQLAALNAIVAELAARLVTARLTTWYRRTCLGAEEGRVRITLDEGLIFCRPQPLGQAGEPVAPPPAVAHGPARIVEIKRWGAEPEWLARAIRDLGAASSFSKFRAGMTALGKGSVPAI